MASSAASPSPRAPETPASRTWGAALPVRFRIAALLAAAAVVARGAAHASDDAELSALLAGMRSTSGVIAEFTETRELALLSSPLESTGTIWFVPPSRLVRLVSSPGRSRLVVDGDRVRFESDTGTQALDLSASPIARQIIDSFVVLFNGDEKRLRELYTVTFEAASGGATAASARPAAPPAAGKPVAPQSAASAGWHLHLVPRSMPLDRMIASFDLYGSDRRIDRMEAVEPDGDRTVTRFGKTDAQHVFSAPELEELFGDAGKAEPRPPR
jgi:outer membrane lipoprotein-sorting protein